ncbi:hypothetical protein MM2B1231_2792 [Mycobacteroides abscessus subsp. bolletii 2B-1231]|uniref:Uncharacterized protein n=1 Tax=Mycobacteroides abscessus MAB_091912_2446 TaxID=1335414 RepID=A0A829MJN1_9MYCO|nr:hypothetical protein MM2B0626_2726 [Mycobacteroides abscessus subsp. bolletii 2B-0626]EIV11932.1 hypothetical protein MM2B0912R_3129 [Mycobacteroides abscessus subsp. bolletii 2B-0912-R]EIV19990.1 hypothetical protein MM2B0912S_2733 [Mycobacteroides abscessus subsp. bolletii 2B-0912-S]EIV74926.1 hypothetical protein MM2B1231_2792 [Mycobacteroides abscessus subsp. bolletii 2B-1231]EIV79032.1 hypothetical protein MM2B0107_2064 [Mycobacteroides abscessus subsp. bolletii 2B-0107]ESV64063.1 hypo
MVPELWAIAASVWQIIYRFGQLVLKVVYSGILAKAVLFS